MSSTNSTDQVGIESQCGCKCSGRLSMVVYALWLTFLVAMVVLRFVGY